MKAALARQKQIRRIRRRGPVSNALSPASPLPSVATRVIESTGTEATSMADSSTIVALQPLRSERQLPVEQERPIQGVRVAETFGTRATWARPSIRNQPKGAASEA
jgi:hypothetical protein